jgi:hypothetical protein
VAIFENLTICSFDLENWALRPGSGLALRRGSGQGAIGFDRMAAVAVACPGCSVGLVNHLSKTLIANTNDVAGRVGFGAASFAMAA